MPMMSSRERWQVALAVLTAFVGPEERRAADITSVASEHDPREVLFGMLALARDLLNALAADKGVSPTEILQALAEQEAEENG
jgi:hypothetical protein